MTWRRAWLADTKKTLDAAIRTEERRPLPDSLKVAELKRRKLAARDELAMLDAGLLSRN